METYLVQNMYVPLNNNNVYKNQNSHEYREFRNVRYANLYITVCPQRQLSEITKVTVCSICLQDLILFRMSSVTQRRRVVQFYSLRQEKSPIVSP